VHYGERLRYVSSYLEGEIFREKEIKKVLQPLTSIFAIDLKKKLNIIPSYGRFQRFRYTYRLWEEKCSYACQVFKHLSNWSCPSTWNGKMQYHAG